MCNVILISNNEEIDSMMEVVQRMVVNDDQEFQHNYVFNGEASIPRD